MFSDFQTKYKRMAIYRHKKSIWFRSINFQPPKITLNY